MAFGQTAITAITTTTTPGTFSSHGTPARSFENTTIAINTISTATSTYNFSSIAEQSYIRRAPGVDNPNRSSVWRRPGIAGGSHLGTYHSSFADLILQNDLVNGSDNTFANGPTGAHSTPDGNIERVDFVFTGGLTVDPSQAFAVFERGNVGQHDLFKIAAITAWDFINNAPLAYGNLVGPSSTASWGTTNPVSSFQYFVYRYNNGDDLSQHPAGADASGTQGVGGILFTMAQLGISPGTTIYGYSLFGNDVTTGGDSANLIDYTNSTFFPINTSNATGTGGIDLAGANGISFTFSAIPEPSTYALFGVTVMLGAIIFHRRRRARPTSTLSD